MFYKIQFISKNRGQFLIMKNTRFILLFIPIVLLSCHKNDQDPPCKPLETLPNYVEWQYEFKDKRYGDVSVNPVNPSELLIYAEVDTSLEVGLFKYNLETKEKTIIYRGNIIFRPKWSVKDWILFLAADGYLKKVKSNGDSLTFLAQGGLYSPEWNNTGTKFACQSAAGPNTQIYFFDESGVLLNSVTNGLNNPCWQNVNDSLMLNMSGVISYMNVYTNEVNFVYEGLYGILGGAWWADERNIVWAYQEGIFMTNIDSKETTTIRTTCDSRFYRSLCYSPVSGKLLFIRTILKSNKKYHLCSDQKIVMMNLDGSCEEEVEIE